MQIFLYRGYPVVFNNFQVKQIVCSCRQTQQ